MPIRHVYTGCAQELDHAVNVLTNDNLELACTVIEKTATDKAVREMDERLIPAFTVHHPFSSPPLCQSCVCTSPS